MVQWDGVTACRGTRVSALVIVWLLYGNYLVLGVKSSYDLCVFPPILNCGINA